MLGVTERAIVAPEVGLPMKGRIHRSLPSGTTGDTRIFGSDAPRLWAAADVELDGESYPRDRLLRVENACHAHLFPTGLVNPRALFARIFRGRM